MLGQEIWTVPASFREQEVTDMSKPWKTGLWVPEGSGEILDENWQEAEKKNGGREEISEEQVDLVIGGLAKPYSKSESESKSKPESKSKRKRKRDDILLPEI